MAEFVLPDKVRIINDATKYPITYKNAAGATVAAASAVEAAIQGFGSYKIAHVKEVAMHRGCTPVLPSYTVTAATAAQITVPGTNPNGATVHFRMVLESTSRRLEVARLTGYEFDIPFEFPVVLDTNDTANKVLYKLFKSINGGAEFNRDQVIKATATNINDTTGTVDSIVITVDEPGDFIREFRAVGEDGLQSAYVTVFAPATTTQMVRALGWGSDVEFLEKLQGGNYINTYHYDTQEVPLQNSYYTEVSWKFSVSRPDPTSANLSNERTVVLYIQETAANETYIDTLADFLLTNLSTRGTAIENGKINVGFNYSGNVTPLTTANTASTATNFDSDEGILTVYKGALNAASSYFIAQVTAKSDTTDDFVLARFKANA